jgi:hypothetical protein
MVADMTMSFLEVLKSFEGGNEEESDGVEVVAR